MSRLDEIKARAEQVHWTSTSTEQAMTRMASSAADVPWLLAEVARLTAEREWFNDRFPCDGVCVDAPEEACSRHGRNPADLWRIIGEVAAERNALAAQVARVEALAEEWRYKGQFGWGAWQLGEGPDPEGYVMDHCASAIRVALADPEADTTDVDVCSGDADCTSALHVHGCFADATGPCTNPDEHQPTDQGE